MLSNVLAVVFLKEFTKERKHESTKARSDD